jgi:predicted ATP-grasp superfamily ATP-dependent carboligase
LIPAVIVNANNIMALSILRSLGRRGIPVICIFGKSNRREPYYNIISSSRYVAKKYFFQEDESGDNLVQCLIGLSINKAEEKSVLFPVGDADMICISMKRGLLKNKYRLLMPAHGTLENLLCKEKFFEFATRNALPIPRTYIINQGTDIEKVGKEARFPCVLKPSWRNSHWLRRYRNEKVLHVAGAKELNDKFQEISRHVSGFVLQEVVAGGEDQILCSFVYLNEFSEPLAMFMCKKLRQFPRRFGNTALAESVFDPEVARLTVSICKKLELVGYASIEFKRNSDDGCYKILEITPSRLNRQVGLADAAGMNIPYIWYCHQVGKTLEVKDYNLATRWLSEVNDFRALSEYIRAKEYTLKTWINSYRGIRSCEVFAKDDLNPLLKLCLASNLRR